MVTWHASGRDSYAVDRYSTGNDTPLPDAKQDYSTTIRPSFDGNGVIFKSIRKVDTGDRNDYLLELDKDLTLNYAFNLKTSEFIYHGTGNRKALGIRFRSNGTVQPYLEAFLPPKPFFAILALNEWFLWTVLGFFMVAARRYFAHKYGLSMTIHVVFATIASGLTMFLGIQAKSHLGWNFY